MLEVELNSVSELDLSSSESTNLVETSNPCQQYAILIFPHITPGLLHNGRIGWAVIFGFWETMHRVEREVRKLIKL